MTSQTGSLWSGFRLTSRFSAGFRLSRGRSFTAFLGSLNVRLCRSGGLSDRLNNGLLCLLSLGWILNLCGLSLLVFIQFQIFCLLFVRFYI
nr:MAG TPA: hypothetical protein [Caudoviricetes sp.]